MTMLNETIINKLNSAVTDLESAISRARTSMAQMESVPEETIKRLSSYDSILISQRSYIKELETHIQNKNSYEVNRVVILINHLSSMIRDDVKSVLAALSGSTFESMLDNKINFC